MRERPGDRTGGGHPDTSAVAQSPPSEVAHRAAAFACGLAREGAPADVLASTKANLLYDLVCAVTAVERAGPAWSLARGTAPATATLLGDGERVHVEQAAFANGVLMHARAQDDTHYPSQTHPGAAVIPAALALSERFDASGARFLAAVIAGYEVAATVGEELSDAVIERGFRAASLFGVLGAATAGAVAAGLDEERTAYAIALGASFASGLAQTWTDGAEEWSYQLGAAARSGVTATLLADAGVRAAGRALDGADGFAAAFAGAELTLAWPGEPGGRWRMMEVIHKLYPACNIVQAPVAATLELVDRHGLAAADVRGVRCALNPDDWAYPGTLGTAPFPGTGGPLMSVPFCIAVAIVRRGLPLDALGATGSDEFADLAGLIGVEPDGALGRLDARVEIETARGEVLTSYWRGDAASYAWSWPEIVSWASALGGELSESHLRAIERVIEAVEQIDDAGGVSALAAATVIQRRHPRKSLPEEEVDANRN
jgi:2-methylcitrate dehydratase PrpD